MFVKQVFSWLSHFLRICILLVPKTLKNVLNDSNFFYIFLTYWYQNYAEFYVGLKSVETLRKRTPRKSYLPKVFCKLVVLKSKDFHFAPCFVSKFFAFSHHFRNQSKILRCFDTHMQKRNENFLAFMSILCNVARIDSKFCRTCFTKVSQNFFLHHILQEFNIKFLTRFRTYKIATPPQTKMTIKDDIQGMVSLKFLHPSVFPTGPTCCCTCPGPKSMISLEIFKGIHLDACVGSKGDIYTYNEDGAEETTDDVIVKK